jgi:sphingolipid delta-4 desaturase
LKAHPEVGKLMGCSHALKYKIIAAFLVQWASLELLKGAPLWMTFVCCYTLSGMITGSMTLALHELSHNLGAKKPIWNRVLSMIANTCMGIPAAATFKRYHAEHHKFLGEHHIDVDIPTYFEGNWFKNGHLSKMMWLFFQPAWYSLRPMVLNTKDPNSYEFINYACTITADLLVYSRYGIPGVLYLILGTIMGMQWHPVAGHFVAEHYVFNEGQETYSYYGPLNWVCFNVGYHIEHHDFPYVAESKLAVLRKTAPEFYDYPHYHSWVKVMYDFVMDPYVTPFSRIKRKELSPEEFVAFRKKGGLCTK